MFSKIRGPGLTHIGDRQEIGRDWPNYGLGGNPGGPRTFPRNPQERTGGQWSGGGYSGCLDGLPGLVPQRLASAVADICSGFVATRH